MMYPNFQTTHDTNCKGKTYTTTTTTTTQQQHSLFSQASWGRLEMKSERNKFKGEQARKDIK